MTWPDAVVLAVGMVCFTAILLAMIAGLIYQEAKR